MFLFSFSENGIHNVSRAFEVARLTCVFLIVLKFVTSRDATQRTRTGVGRKNEGKRVFARATCKGLVTFFFGCFFSHSRKREGADFLARRSIVRKSLSPGASSRWKVSKSSLADMKRMRQRKRTRYS